ncbi:MAG: IS630 family transposase, partial [bacterium]
MDFNYSQTITIISVNRIQQHAQIALLDQIGLSISSVAAFVNRHITTVKRWIRRFKEANQLKDRTRSGRPPLYSEVVRLKTIAFYCQTAPLPGLSRFSLRDAQEYIKTRPQIQGCSMSYSTIGRILREHGLRPHLNKYFLNITDPDFFPKALHIIYLYFNAPEFLFCVDECPGLQALMPLDPDLLAIANKPNYRDFLYSRKGTTDLIAFFRVQDGQVFGRCTENHNRHTFISVFEQHVRLWPSDKQLHYIVDNYMTHCHEDFCQLIAKLCNDKYYPLKTAHERRQWLQKNDKRVVIHFTPFHGSWLNQIELWFRILSQKCLKPRRFESVSMLQQEILNFIETWNNFLAHPFKWTYTGEGLQEKVVSRFNKLLLIESSQLDVSFLNKQFQLMANIVRDFPNVAKTKQWT